MLNWLKKDKTIYAWVSTIIWASVILFFALLPYNLIPSLTVSFFDNLIHFFEYFILAILLIRSFYRSTDLSPFKITLFALIMATGYGIVLELIQNFAPGRTPSFEDVISNIAGIVGGIIFGRTILWRK